MYLPIDYIISVANFIKIPMKETCVSKYAKDFELKQVFSPLNTLLINGIY